MMKLAMIPLLALALAACSNPPEPQAQNPAPAPAPAPASTAIADSNPLKPLFDDRDKAKAVQQQVLDNAEKQRKAIEAAGG